MSEKIYLEYNPYLKKSTIKTNNVDLPRENKLHRIEKGYLQNWLGSYKDWKGLPQELMDIINDDFDLTFRGRQIDYDDLKDCFEQANEQEQFGDVQYSLHWIESAGDELVMQKLDHIINQLEQGPFPELKDPKLRENYENAKKAVFEVNVMATMSSGKSTILNAMLGRELLPSKNEACTATIVRITANENLSDFKAECRDQKGNIIIPLKKVQDTDLDNYNNDTRVHYIDLEGPIPTLQSSKMQLRLIDTPGPNNSRETRHEEITYSIVNNLNTSMILYVLNATQLGINDDKEFFDNIRDSMRKQGKAAQDRVLFVLNKCDELDPDDGESLEQVINRLRDNLKARGIERAKIIPVTALIARLIRQVQCGEKLTRKERSDLDGYIRYFADEPKMFFEQYADLSPSCRKKLDVMLEQAETGEEKMLIHTGIPALELTIQEYLDKYAYPMKLEDIRKEYSARVKGLAQNRMLEKKVQDGRIEKSKLEKQVKELHDIRQQGKYKKIVENRIKDVSLDLSDIKSIYQEIRKKENDLFYPYRAKDSVESSEVDKLLDEFKQYAENEMDKIFGQIQSKSVLTIQQASEDIYEIYNSYIKKLGMDFQLEEYDLETALQMGGVTVGNFEELLDFYITQNTTTEDIMETKERKKTRIEQKAVEIENPKKRWWAFWRPAKIEVMRDYKEEYKEEYQVKVGKKTVVNVSEVVAKFLSKYVSELEKTCKAQEKRMLREFAQIKDYVLTTQMQKLDMELKKIEEELDGLSKEKVKTEQEICVLEKNLNWLKESKKSLEELFEFK